MRFLLDTNAYTALMRGNASVVEAVRQAGQVLMSAVVVGELLYGFRHGKLNRDNVRQLDGFLRNPYVRFLAVTRESADRFGLVASALRRRGTPIPSNDIWIAAHALESGASLLSYDSHFSVVDGLVWVHPDHG